MCTLIVGSPGETDEYSMATLYLLYEAAANRVALRDHASRRSSRRSGHADASTPSASRRHAAHEAPVAGHHEGLAGGVSKTNG